MARPGPSLLQEWRKSSQLNQVQMAALIGVDQSSVSEYERGRAIPRVDMAHRIEVVTGGAVPMTSWLDSEDQSPPAASDAGNDTVTGDSAAE